MNSLTECRDGAGESHCSNCELVPSDSSFSRRPNQKQAGGRVDDERHKRDDEARNVHVVGHGPNPFHERFRFNHAVDEDGYSDATSKLQVRATTGKRRIYTTSPSTDRKRLQHVGRFVHRASDARHVATCLLRTPKFSRFVLSIL
jgi:hypothetical protein